MLCTNRTINYSVNEVGLQYNTYSKSGPVLQCTIIHQLKACKLFYNLTCEILNMFKNVLHC